MIKFHGVSDDLVEIEGPGIGQNISRSYWLEHNLIDPEQVPDYEDEFGETYIDGSDQEHDCYGDTDVLSVYRVGDELTVYAIFTTAGTWTFAWVPNVSFREGPVVEDDYPEMPWKVELRARADLQDVKGGRPYSAALYIDAPEGTPVRRISPSDGGKRIEPDQYRGAGTYRVKLAVPGPDGETEYVWQVNHYNHALNKARKRGLFISKIELVEEA